MKSHYESDALQLLRVPVELGNCGSLECGSEPNVYGSPSHRPGNCETIFEHFSLGLKWTKTPDPSLSTLFGF